MANNIDESAYVQRHCCNGEYCIPLAPHVSRLSAVLRRGDIPIFSFEYRANQGLFLDVVKYEPTPEYIAISHVWSDGRGNPTANTLPMCELDRIMNWVFDLQKLLRGEPSHSTSTPAHARMLVWMDTLCVPVAEELKDLRKTAIQRMRSVYMNAKAVLVLDAEYMTASSLKDSDEEQLMRLCGSAWMRRVWTLQEAILGLERLWICMDDGAYHLMTKVKVFRERLRSQPHWLSSLWIAAECGTIFLIMEVLTKSDATDIVRIAYSLSQFGSRSTSKPGDEVICLATVLGLDLAHIVHEEDYTGRMKLLFRQLREVPPSLLFSHTARIDEDGLRWAPARIGGQGGVGLLDPHRSSAAHIRDEGMVLRRPGLLVSLTSLPNDGFTCIIPDCPREYVAVYLSDVAAACAPAFTDAGVECAMILEPETFVSETDIDITFALTSIYQPTEDIIFARFHAIATLVSRTSSLQKTIFLPSM